MSIATILPTSNMPARSSIVSTSSSEASSTLSAHARRMSFPKSDVQIHLKNHFKSKTYTSSSPLSGEVRIITQRDVPFDSIEIVLLGCSKTRTEGYSTPHESTHTFLRMMMPMPESVYPLPRVLENGRTVNIPFNFVLPNFLTLNACGHKGASDQVRDQHLCLPPSMGSWARSNWEKDDLAPRMAEVEYCVKARVWRQPELRGRRVKVMEAIKPIQVLPAFAEDAPLSITKEDSLYRMSKSKTIRKNLITAKLGKLTVSGQQPRAIILHPDGTVAADTTAQVDLKFEPVSADYQPPKVTGVSSKIAAHSYYSAAPINTLPNLGDWDKSAVPDRRGVYFTSVSVPGRLSEKIGWLTYQARRDSGYCSDTAPENIGSDEDDCEEDKRQRQRRLSSTIANLVRPSKQQSPSRRPLTSPVYHTAAIRIPINLPTAKKTFVPTFHSCIVSRVYTLHVYLTVASGPTTSSTVSLILPLQIAVEAVAPNLNAGEELPSFEDAVEDAAVDDFLRPRLLGVPGVQFQETSVLPGYGER